MRELIIAYHKPYWVYKKAKDYMNAPFAHHIIHLAENVKWHCATPNTNKEDFTGWPW